MKIRAISVVSLTAFVCTAPCWAENSPPGLKTASSKTVAVDSVALTSVRPTVELFVTSWCGYCKMLERILRQKGVTYKSYDIEKDEDAAQTYHELGGRGVPLVRVGSKIVYGYNPEMVMSYVDGE